MTSLLVQAVRKSGNGFLTTDEVADIFLSGGDEHFTREVLIDALTRSDAILNGIAFVDMIEAQIRRLDGAIGYHYPKDVRAAALAIATDMAQKGHMMPDERNAFIAAEVYRRHGPNA